jgi:serine/threonine protein kinase
METGTQVPATEQTTGAEPAPSPDLTGTTLGDFHILRRLGQGGMGHVYLAEQLSLKRKVALKLLRPDVASNGTALQRFKAEAENLARLTHANIVQVYDFKESGGQWYMALEYVEGRNLREFLAKKGPPDVLLGLSIMRQVAAALLRASEFGIIHRDIKPENILLTKKGEVKVADFGLSRVLAGDGAPAGGLNITQSGVTMGTPLYMSPEQVQGTPVDPRTDIYSFGVTCYHMLAGHPPFQGKTPFDVAVKHVKDEPEPLSAIRPDLPPELCAIIHRMMAKDPAGRYQSSRELLKDLALLRERLSGTMSNPQTQAVSLSGVNVQAETLPVPSFPSVPLPQRRRRSGLVVVLFVLSLVLAAAAGALIAWRQPHDMATAADASAATAPDADPVRNLKSPKQREQDLIRMVEEYNNPGGDQSRVQLGVGHRIELGVFYLDEWRLDDADHFFQGLISSPPRVPRYVQIGIIGHAIVLAFRSEAEASNQIFLTLVHNDRRAEAKRFEGLLMLNPHFRRKVLEALDYNERNATLEKPFPADLQTLRKVLATPLPGQRKPANDKAAGKTT